MTHNSLPDPTIVVSGDAESTVRGIDGRAAKGGRLSRMEIDSGALMFASIVNGILGLLFWAVAARTYPTAEIGKATTIINAAIMIGTLSNLSLNPMYERFLPESGKRGPRLICGGHLLSAGVAGILGAGFVVFGPSDYLFDSTMQKAVFPLCAIVLGAFALDDSILIGLRRGRWTAAKNIFHAVSKLVIMLTLASVGDSHFVVTSWVVPAAAAVVVVQGAIFVRGFGVRAEFDSVTSTLPRAKSLFRDFGSLYGIVVINSVAPFLLPLMVVSALGVTDAAYFAMGWVMVSAVTLVMSMIAGPFVAESAARPHAIADLLKRQVRLLLLVSGAGLFFLAVVAPCALRFVGADYADEGTDLLRLMAVVQVLSVPGFLFGGLARIYRKLTYALIVQVSMAAAVTSAAWWQLPRLGIDAVGWSYLVMEFAMIAAVAIPLWRMSTAALSTPVGALDSESADNARSDDGRQL